jgi:hypothetical protein
MRPTLVLSLAPAEMRRSAGAPPLNSDVRRHLTNCAAIARKSRRLLPRSALTKIKRDRRLLVSLLLLIAALVAIYIQAFVTTIYHHAAASNDWALLLKYFPSAALPPVPPGAVCFDNCSPDLPFIAGWVAIGCFALGLLSLTYCWWKPIQQERAS